MKRVIILISILAVTLLSSLVISFVAEITVPRSLRDLSKYYIANTIIDTASPESVAAIVWDYRGLDTVYETLVLYLAIVGGLAIFTIKGGFPRGEPMGLTELSRNATKIIVLLIATVSAAIAFHGHLTPGGGFPGGSALAVATMLIIPVYSVNILLEKGITSTKLVAIRGFALTGLGLVALLPVVKGLEIVTNQKFYPGFLNGVVISGSISLYNLLEFLAVASGFTAVALYLSIPEELYKGEVRD
ncbi:MAG: Na(+)/H(+) antiporter subunit B [Desulfurococcaceae archaeon]